MSSSYQSHKLSPCEKYAAKTSLWLILLTTKVRNWWMTQRWLPLILHPFGSMRKSLCATQLLQNFQKVSKILPLNIVQKNSELMYAGGILSFYFIWFNPIRMSFQLCFTLKCKENTEVIPKMDWKWPRPKMSEKLTDAGTIADPSSLPREQHGGKWWPPPNEKLTRKSRSINQRDKSFLIRNCTKCPLLEHFVICFGF